MLSKTKTCLIKCLNDYLHENTSSFKMEPEEWEQLLEISFDQGIAAIVLDQCGSLIPEELRYKNRRFYLSNKAIVFRRQNELSELIRHLDELSIPVVFMKGSVLMNYYPKPYQRSMWDLDLVIRDQDREKVDKILQKEMNYRCFIDNHSVWTYIKKPVYLEVHTHMFYENLANDIDYVGYFDHIFEHIKHGKVFDLESDSIYIPEENYHFLYLMTHTAKHIINSGSGFRAYLDMVLMTQKCNLDWEWIKEELIKLKLLEFTETCFALCEKWFDVKMPLEHKELDPSFFEEITEKTFHDGVFGLSNKANEGAHSAKEIKRKDRGYWVTAIHLSLRMLFPSYQDMILPEWYSFLRGRPWLLPFGWVYRWIYCIVHKSKASLNRLTEPFRIKKKIEKREDYISSWGL